MTSREPFVVRGGGETGALIRSTDWSRTPLGPMKTWPSSLRTALSIMLGSRYPMFLWWSPSLVNFYNDGYIPVLGKRHPEAMGRSARDVWSEIWDVLGPQTEIVMRSGAATWNDRQLLVMERNGFVEETYFSWSYSPAHDESGAVGGVFCACTEDTRRVLGERRLRTLREVAADARGLDNVHATAEAALGALARNRHDLPFALLYLADADGTMELAGRMGIDDAPAALTASHPVRGEWPLPAGGVVAPGAPWPERVTRALAVPVLQPGSETPAVVLVAGISPRLALDDEYRQFVELVTGQVARAVAEAQAFEAERQRAQALAELDRAKTTFFSNVSHELRTPLTLMLGPVEDLLDRSGSTLPGADRELLAVARRNGQRLLKLVNTLLDFARIEAGRVQARFEPTDLATLTADLASNFRSACERAGLQLTVACPPLGGQAYVDRGMWERIVLNLLSNAFKFTLEGGIDVTLREADGHAEFTVRDTGCGIPEALLPELFERFHRIKGTRGRSHEGTGIGLALVRELARLHGGDVHVASRDGGGSAFTVRIPLGNEHLSAAQIERSGVPAATGAIAGAFVEEALSWLGDRAPDLPDEPGAVPGPLRGRILLVEDNVDMRDYIVRLLRNNYRVETTPDGEAALAALRGELPDAVISDAMMPRLDGFALLRAVRSDERTRTLPFLMLSARAGEESRIEGLQSGADDYVVKPFSARELIARVDAAVALGRVRREATEQARASEQRLAADVAVLDRLQRLSTRLVPSGDFTELLAEILDAAIEITGAQRGNVQLLQNGALHIAVQRGFEAPFLQFFDSVADEPAACGTAMHRGERVVVEDVEQSPIFAGTPALQVLLAAGVRAVQSTPLVSRSGRLVGMFSTHYDRAPRAPTGRELRLLDVLARQAADFIERTQTETEIRAHEQMLIEGDRRKDEFLATLAHELRNPLAPVRTAAEVLRASQDPSHTAAAREVIERQVAHMSRLIDDLMDASRISRGKVELRRERVALGAAVHAAVESNRPLIVAAGQTLTVNVPAAPLWVDADAPRLTQVFANLLDNASKYSPRGARIFLDAEAAGAMASVRVRDTGAGIAPEMLDRVWQMFVQGDQPVDRTQRGLGIGLTLVKSLVELHGGSVHAKSDGPGHGAEFIVRLPLAPAPAAGADLGARPDAGPESLVKARVLVADDNEDAAQSLGMLLEIMGCQVRTAPDGAAALDVAAEFRPDLALLDLGMPRVDGFDLARRIRAEPWGRGMTLVAVTGWGQQQDRKRSADAGFDHHLVKPIGPEAVRSLVTGSIPAGTQ